MNETLVKQVMAQSAKEIFGSIVFTSGYKPSDFFSEIFSQLDTDFNTYWEQIFNQEKEKFVGGIWTGGQLPNGHPAPSDAVPGASYWIMIPNGSLIFQYVSSPFVPETPVLVPGSLTTENVEEAMNNHINHLAETNVVQFIVSEYINWLSSKLL